MAGVAGSQPSNLVDPNANAMQANAANMAVAQAKPVPMQQPPAQAAAPQRPSLDQIFGGGNAQGEDQAAQGAQQAKPSLDDIFTSPPQQADWEKKSVDLPGVGKVTAGGAVRGALDTLPTVGAIGGGIAGTPADVVSGPAGTVVGAGLGAAAGESLKQSVGKALFGDTYGAQSVGEAAKDIGVQGALGAAGEGAGQVVAKGIEKTTKYALSKAGDMDTKAIELYAKNAEEIKTMYRAAGKNLSEAADNVKRGFDISIRAVKQTMNDKIGAALEHSPAKVDVQPLYEAVDQLASKVGKNVYKDAEAKEILGLKAELDKITKESPATVNVQNLNYFKQEMQDQASAVYSEKGKMFPDRGDKFAEAAKSIGAKARLLLNKAVPDVAEANNKLAALHTIDDSMNQQLLKQGKSEASLVGAGSGKNQANANALSKLGELTHTDMLDPAKKLYAMKEIEAREGVKAAGVRTLLSLYNKAPGLATVPVKAATKTLPQIPTYLRSKAEDQ